MMPAHRSARRARRQRLHACVAAAGLARIGDGERQVGTRLRDLLRPAAVHQARNGLPLRGHGRLGLCDLRRETAGVEPREHLALLDAIAFLHQDRRDALAAVERQLHLTQIDVTVQNEIVPGAVAMREPPAESDEHAGRCDRERNRHVPFHGAGPLLGRCGETLDLREKVSIIRQISVN